MSETFTPHGYQVQGVELLTDAPGGVGLLLEPGLGKTIIALMAFLRLRDKYPGLQMLVVVPINPMYGTWPEEIAKWRQTCGLTSSIIHGTLKQREEALATDVDVYLVNPEGLRWLFAPAQKKLLPDWSLLCVDESTKFKRSTSKRSKLLKPHLKKFIWRWIMTGTIAPNGLEDLYGQVYIMDLGNSLGRYITHYRNKYFYQTGFGGYDWTPREGATEEVARAIDSKVLQLKAKDYIKMPEFILVKRKVKLPRKAYAAYQEMKKELIIEVAGVTVVASNQGAASMKCRQIANGAVYGVEGSVTHIHDAKLEALNDIMEETNGHPLLVMYEFKHDRERIQKYLGNDCVCITGLRGDSLIAALRSFNAGMVKYLLMHAHATHGINIQKACSHIVWFSIIWDLELLIQANCRLQRQGQTSPSVMCYMICAESTTDLCIIEALSEKACTQESIENALRKYCGMV